MFRQPIPPRAMRSFPTTLFASLVLMAFTGCGRTPTEAPQTTPMKATAITAERRNVPDVRRYPGTSQAVQQAMIVARLTGYLEARHFEAGTLVSEGDLLFTIEQAPFEAAVTSARGRLDEAIAQVAYADIEFQRNQPLVSTGAISASDWDGVVAAKAEADGLLEAAMGELEAAEIDLTYTTVEAPFSGRIGERLVDVGNLVGPESNENLAELVSVDPIRIVFDPPARDAASFRKAWTGGSVPVTATIERDRGPADSIEGTLDLVDNVVDPSTSTFLARAEIPNPRGDLMPGTYAPVAVRLDLLRDQVVVPEQAIFKDTQYSYVWSIEDGKARRRNVTVGTLWNGLRVVEGIAAGTVVVIAGDSVRIRDGSVLDATVGTLSAWEATRSDAGTDEHSDGGTS